jgi:hypothetical protein
MKLDRRQELNGRKCSYVPVDTNNISRTCFAGFVVHKHLNNRLAVWRIGCVYVCMGPRENFTVTLPYVFTSLPPLHDIHWDTETTVIMYRSRG